MSTEYNDFDNEFDIPLCIFDLLTICKEYSMLGWSIQAQVEHILDLGVEKAIQDGHVKLGSLSKIKSFLQTISKNPYFGDCIDESEDIIELINLYQDKHPELFQSKSN
jgi:hypothetical protein